MALHDQAAGDAGSVFNGVPALVSVIPTRRATRLYHRGLVRARRGRMRAAVRAWERSLHCRQAHAEAWSELGRARGVLGDWAHAAEAFRQAAALRPSRPSVWADLAGAMAELGAYEAAAEACRWAAALEPRPWRVRCAGLVYGPREEDGASTERRPGAWNDLGNGLFQLGWLREALRCYRRALRQSPDYDPAWNNLGVALDELGDHAGAAAALERALDADAGETTYLVNRAVVLVECGRRAEAFEHLARALRAEPERRAVVTCRPQLHGLIREFAWTSTRR